MCSVFTMMIVDIFVYFLLGYFVSQVFPGQYGVPRKWSFFLHKSFWCPKRRKPNGDVKNKVSYSFTKDFPGSKEAVAANDDRFLDQFISPILSEEFSKDNRTTRNKKNEAYSFDTSNRSVGLLNAADGCEKKL